MADSLEVKKEKLSSMSAAVKVVIDGYPIGHEFYGNELKEDVVFIYPDAVNMYPDTILKMARRHRRDSYISINRNNSLYKRVKSDFEIYQEKIELTKEVSSQTDQVEASPYSQTLDQSFLGNQLEHQEQLSEQSEYSLFPQGFFAFFFVVFFGCFFSLESGYGRPLFPPSFIASKSSSVYNPAEPTYLNGSRPFLLRRILTAADEVSNRCAISNTVIPSILLLYRQNLYINQVTNDEMLQHCNILLHRRIVILSNFLKISENSFQNLDYPLGRVYYVYMLQHCNIKKSGSEETESRKSSIGAKGDLYDERKDFAEML